MKAFARRHAWARPVILAAVLAGIAACGSPSRETPSNEVDVALSEWSFTSSRTTFVAGVPYRFVLRNVGAVAHEWAVVPRGAADEQEVLTEVEEDRLPPGATVTVEYTFPRSGDFDFACFVPGHFSAGMKLPVTVTES